MRAHIGADKAERRGGGVLLELGAGVHEKAVRCEIAKKAGGKNYRPHSFVYGTSYQWVEFVAKEHSISIRNIRSTSWAIERILYIKICNPIFLLASGTVVESPLPKDDLATHEILQNVIYWSSTGQCINQLSFDSVLKNLSVKPVLVFPNHFRQFWKDQTVLVLSKFRFSSQLRVGKRPCSQSINDLPCRP